MPLRHRTNGSVCPMTMIENGNKVYHLEHFVINGLSLDLAALGHRSAMEL